MLSFLSSLTRRWRLVAALVVAGLLAGVVYHAVVTPSYRATSQIFVSISGGDSATDLNQGVQFSASRVKSYPDLVDSPVVLGPVIKKLGLDESTMALAGHVSAVNPVNTVLIDVSADNADARQAQRISDAVATQLSLIIANLDRPAAGRTSPVKAYLVHPADLPQAPRTPIAAVDLLLGLILGALAAMLAVALLDRRDGARIASSRPVTSSTGTGPGVPSPTFASPVATAAQAD